VIVSKKHVGGGTIVKIDDEGLMTARKMKKQVTCPAMLLRLAKWHYDHGDTVTYAFCKLFTYVLLSPRSTSSSSYVVEKPTLLSCYTLFYGFLIQGVPEKNAHSLCTTILQPYVTESFGFQ